MVSGIPLFIIIITLYPTLEKNAFQYTIYHKLFFFFFFFLKRSSSTVLLKLFAQFGLFNVGITQSLIMTFHSHDLNEIVENCL